MLTTQEVAGMLGIAERTVTHLASRGELQGESDWRGKRRVWLFRREAIEAYKAELEQRRQG